MRGERGNGVPQEAKGNAERQFQKWTEFVPGNYIYVSTIVNRKLSSKKSMK